MKEKGIKKKLEENTFWIYTKYTCLLGFMLIPCMSLEMKKFHKAFNVVLALKFLQRWTNSFDKIKEIYFSATSFSPKLVVILNK